MRVLWLLIFGGLIGWIYYFSHLPETPGLAKPTTFRWAMLWAPKSSVAPSERLSLYVQDGVKELRAPLGREETALSAKEVQDLAEEFRSEAGLTRKELWPVYEAAVANCQTLLAMIEARRVAVARLQALGDEVASRATLGMVNPIVRSRLIEREWTVTMGKLETQLVGRYDVLRQREKILNFGGAKQ